MSSLKNTTINDTGYLRVAKGTTGERPGTPDQGMLRYNTTTGNLETYTANNNWGGLEPPPQISSISGTINVDTNGTITITGNNFVSGAVVSISGAGVSNVTRSLTTTFVSATQLTAATNAASVNYVGGQSYNVTITNPSGNAATLSSAGVIDRDPVWSTGAGNIGTIYDASRAGKSFTVTATDPDGGTPTYSLTSGSLPTGMSLSSGGVISGTPNAVGSDTTYTFGITPTLSGYNGPERSFNIVVKAPVIVSYTGVGTTTWTAPTGVDTVRVLVVAGGGGGGTRNAWNSSGTDGGAGGGAGGMIDHPAFPVTPGGGHQVIVGGGGGGGSGSQTPGARGGDSWFGSLQALGGGYGGCGPLSPNPGGPGGSGGGEGGGGGSNPTGSAARGSGLQPSQPGGSGTYGYGNPGGYASVGGQPGYSGSGGGGAGSGGSDGNGSRLAYGGTGRNSDITGSTLTYAGGGGGGWSPGVPDGGPGGSGIGGQGGNPADGNGRAGLTNRGGGGGGGAGQPAPWPGSGGSGGPGIVVIKY